jgi:hypothetical protein
MYTVNTRSLWHSVSQFCYCRLAKTNIMSTQVTPGCGAASFPGMLLFEMPSKGQRHIPHDLSGGSFCIEDSGCGVTRRLFHDIHLKGYTVLEYLNLGSPVTFDENNFPEYFTHVTHDEDLILNGGPWGTTAQVAFQRLVSSILRTSEKKEVVTLLEEYLWRGKDCLKFLKAINGGSLDNLRYHNIEEYQRRRKCIAMRITRLTKEVFVEYDVSWLPVDEYLYGTGPMISSRYPHG